MRNLAIVLVLIIGGGVLVYGMSRQSQTVVPLQTSGSGTEAVITPVVTSRVETTPAQEVGVKQFTVEGSDFSFSPNTIEVNKGDKVQIVFVNKVGFHDWVVDEFNARTKQLPVGQSETVEFIADKTGTFEFYCSVGSHRAKGMVGKLVVS